MNTKSHLRTRMLCEGALMVALAQILGYLKLAEAPNGGSITFAMFPIILFAVRWGLRPGLMAGFLFGLSQLIFDGAYAWGWPGYSAGNPGGCLPARWQAAWPDLPSIISAASPFTKF